MANCMQTHSFHTTSLGPGGIQDTQMGQLYQIKLLLKFMLEAKRKNRNFTLVTEIKEALKFDDLVIDLEYFGKRFLQAKHKKDSSKELSFKSFFPDSSKKDDFDLFKYFDSYDEISRNSKFTDLQDTILATNSKIKHFTSNIVELTDINQNKICLEKVGIDDETFGSFEFRFKLETSDSTRNQETKNSLKCYFIAVDLQQCIKGNENYPYKFLTSYRSFLEREVVDVSTKKFRTLNAPLASPLAALLYGILKLKNVDLAVDLTILDKIYKNVPRSPTKEREMDQKIENFMKDFLLVTNYEMKDIDDSCCEILQNNFNLRNTDHIKKQFVMEIDEWLIKMQSPNHYLDTDKLEELITRIKDTLLTTQRIIGRNMSEIQETSHLVFKKVEPTLLEFLRSYPANQILYISTEEGERKFIRQKIFQTIRNDPDDTFIFLRTSYLEEDLDKGVKAFEFKGIFDLCVIECDGDVHKYQDLKPRLFEIVKNDNKKKILVIHEGNTLMLEMGVLCMRQDQIKLADLEDTALRELLTQSTVYLQGHQTTYANLININDKSMLERIALRGLLETKVIGTTFTESIEFSKPFDSDLFIQRTLVHKIELNMKILEDFNVKDNITFNDSEFESWSQDLNRKDFHLVIREPINSWDKDKFKLYWKKSKGNIQGLKQHFLGNCSVRSMNYSSRITAIVDSAGMGKTTYLHQKTKQMKEEFKDYFVVNVCLNNHTKYLDTNEFTDENLIVKFLGEEVLKLGVNSSKLQKEIGFEVLRDAVTNSGKFIVILDGADEIAPMHEEKFLKMLKLLIDTKAAHIFVSTRPELTEKIENTTQQFQQTLLPFTTENQIEYLVKYWSKHSTKSASDRKTLQDFAKKLLEFLSQSIISNSNILTGIPLFTRMIAEIYNDDVLKPIDKIKQIKNMIQLYENFIEKSLDFFFKDKNKFDSSNPINLITSTTLKKTIIDLLKRFALTSTNILDQEEKDLIQHDLIQLTEDELRLIQKCGFVYGSLDNLKFIHQTFAEYLIALYFLDHINDTNFCELFFPTIVKKEKLGVVRSFLSCYPDVKKLKNFLKLPKESSITRDFLEDWDKFLINFYARDNMFSNIMYLVLLELDMDTKLASETDVLVTLPNETMEIKSGNNKSINIKSGNETIGSVLQELFLKNGSSLLMYFYKNDELKVFEKLIEKFGLKFIEKFLQTKRGPEINSKSLLGVANFGENTTKILRWINENLHELDQRALKQLFTEKNKDGYSCIHSIFYLQDRKLQWIDTLLATLDELKIFYTKIGDLDGFTNYLLNIESENNIIFKSISWYFKESEIKKIIHWIGKENLVKCLLQDKKSYFHFLTRLVWTNEDPKKIVRFIIGYLGNQDEKNSEIILQNLAQLAFNTLIGEKLPNSENFPEFLFEFGILNRTASGCQFTLEELKRGFGGIYMIDHFDTEEVATIFLDTLQDGFKYNEDIYTGKGGDFRSEYYSILEEVVLMTGYKIHILSAQINVKSMYGKLLREKKYKRIFLQTKIKSSRIFLHLLNILLDTTDETSNRKITENILNQKTRKGATFLHRFYAMNWQRLWGSGISSEIVNQLKLIREKFSMEKLEQLFLIPDKFGKNFLFYIIDGNLTEATMKFLDEYMDENFVDQLLSMKDLHGNSIYSNLYKNYRSIEFPSNSYFNGFAYLKKEIFKKQLLMLNNKEENFLFSITYEAMNTSSFQQLFNCLDKIHMNFPNDLEMFKELLTRKTKKGISFIEYYETFNHQFWTNIGSQSPLIKWLIQKFGPTSANIILQNFYRFQIQH